MASHITIDARLIHAGGIGTFLKTLLSFLSLQKKYRLTLLGFCKDRSFLSRFSPEILLLKSPIYTLQEQVELQRKIPSCDLFIAPHFNIPLLPLRAKKRLTTIHDAFHLERLHELPLLQKIYAQLFYRAAVKLSDQVVTVSQFSKKRLNHYLRPKKEIAVIHNGLYQRGLSAPILETVKKKLQLPSRFLLAMGTVKGHKNLSRLLEAHTTLDIPLYLIGKGKSGQKDLIYTGEVTDEEVAALYSLATLFIFPSLYEGFGYPPLEAMEAGCPVIASSVASIPEICQEGVAYVNPYDVGAIRSQLRELLNNSEKRKALQYKGKQVAAQYTQEHMGKKYVSLIEEMVCQ